MKKSATVPPETSSKPSLKSKPVQVKPLMTKEGSFVLYNPSQRTVTMPKSNRGSIKKLEISLPKSP